MASTDLARRGEIWLVALGAGSSGEPGKTRPAVVISSDRLLTGEADDLIIVVPISSSSAPSPLRIELTQVTELERPSRAICRAMRSVVASRLVRFIGRVDERTMLEIEQAIALILEVGISSSDSES